MFLTTERDRVPSGVRGTCLEDTYFGYFGMHSAHDHCVILLTIMVLNSLPPEIVLYIFSYLPLSSLSQLSCLSRPWNTFLLQHEATVYRRAAFLHGFIDDDSVSLESMKSSNKYSERVLADVDSWKKLCTYL